MKKFLFFLLFCASLSFALEWKTNQTYYSKSAGRDLHYNLLLPSGYNWQTNKYYPVIYFLHGREQSEQTWVEEAAEVFMQTAHSNEFVMVFPQGSYRNGASYKNSWYEYQNGFMGAIAKDLPAELARKKYRLKNIRGIDGISMGGYGAFRISGFASAYFNCRYCGTGAMSGAFVGPKISKALDNISILKTNEIAGAIGPQKVNKIYFDCGDDDIWMSVYNLAEMNMDLANCLMDVGRVKNVDMVFSRPSGKHEWSYWRKRIPEHLDFFSKQLALFPDVTITSAEPYSETNCTAGAYTLTGKASHESGIEKVTVTLENAGQTSTFTAEGTENWSCDLTLNEGANKIKVYARAGNTYTNWCFVNLRVPKEAKPEIELLSHTPGQKYFTYEDSFDIYGNAYADSGITNLYITVVGQKGQNTRVDLEPGETFSATLEPFLGNNAVRVYAVSGKHLTNQVAITVFRGSKDFRVKKVIMNKKRNNLNLYVSNFTQTNLVWLSPYGEGVLTFNTISVPLKQNGWVKAPNVFVSKYKVRNSDDKVTGKIHAKPNKDFLQLTVKLLTTNSLYRSDFLKVPFNASSPLKIKLGDYEVETNIFLDSLGKFKSNAPWF